MMRPWQFPVALRAEPVAAATSVEDVRRDWYDNWAVGDRYYWWIREMFLDPAQLIVEDDEGNLWRMPYSVTSDGELSYGEPSQVVIEYVNASGVDRSVVNLAAVRAMRDVRGSENVAASFESRADSRPNTGGSMDLNKLRQLLRLSADTPDDEVLRQAEERLGESDDDPESGDGGAGGDSQPESTPDAGDGTDDAPEATPPTQASAQVVSITPDTLAELQRQASLGAQAREAQLTAEITSEVSSLVRDGVFPPASLQAYLSACLAEAKAGRDTTLTMLRSLPKNVIPIELRSAQETDASQMQEKTVGYPATWLPEVAARKAAIEASAGRRSRVTGDQRYAGIGGGN